MKPTSKTNCVLPRAKMAVAMLAVCLPFFGMAGCTGGTNEPKPANHIAILIDGSKTFERRRGDAVARAQELIGKIAEKPGRRHQGANDMVAVIAIDAMPSVLWRGTLSELRNTDREGWLRRFAARSDYSSCTDVDSAFRLAIEELGPSSPQIHKYVFVFSDLQHEPPTDSLRRCEKPRIGAADSFPWSGIEDASVSVLWTPPGQKLAWQRAIDSRGLSKSFLVYVDSESAEIVPAPPPVAKRVVTEQERRQTQDRLASALGLGLKIVLGFVLLIVIVIGAVAIAARRRQRVRRGNTPQAKWAGRA
jgi:hypothetical protein